MLKAENICKTYWDRSAKKEQVVLDNCSLEIAAGQVVGLMGPSGCGKSTLARVLLRLVPLTSGKIIFNGQDITHTSNNKLQDFRKKVQFISQRPESFFDPIITLGKSLMEPLQILNLQYSDDEIKSVLELVKLNPALLTRYPHQVSGGEIQRLSIARALLLKPQLLILDEPTSMLDISVQAQILHLLKNIQRERNLSYLFIAHDKDVISWMCDEVLVMDRGRIARSGTV